jgi:hypothetical protein
MALSSQSMIPERFTCSGAASRAIARTPSSRARVTRDLAKFNVFPLGVLAYRSHWEHTRYSSCSCLTRAVTSCKHHSCFHDCTAQRRSTALFQASTSSHQGYSHPKPSSHCIVARDMTCPASIFSTLLHRWTSRRRSFRRKRSRRRSACGRRCRSSRSSIIPASCVPFLSHYFYSLACLLPVLMIGARVRVIVSGLMCSFIAVVRVTVKVPSQFRVRHRLRAL